MQQAPTLEEIREAAETIKPFIHRTPVLTSSTIDGFGSSGGTPVRVLFKCENFQKVGAFKIRGATYAIRQLLKEIDDPSNLTVITHSSGNHAQALALAARQMGVNCIVVMPSNAPTVKKEAVKGYGASINECEPTLEARESTVQTIMQSFQEQATQTGQQRFVHFVPPYDHLNIVRGQGTLGLEFIEQAGAMQRPLDVLIAPVGGGGMLSGVAVAAKALSPTILVFGAEPLGASDAQASFRSKSFVPSLNPTTIADGLLTSLGDITFPLILRHVDDIFTVTDEEITRAMRLIWERLKIVVEPSSCVTLAVVLYSDEFKKRISVVSGRLGREINIGLVLSGGNVDLKTVLEILSTS